MLEGGKIINADNKNSIIATTGKNKLLAVRGLKNYIVIDTPDVLMICPKDEAKLNRINTILGLPEYEEFR